MNPTITLLKNDLRWAGPLGLLGLLGHLAAMIDDGVGSLWIHPYGQWGVMNIIYYACAAGFLGLVAVLTEELTRTRDYLLHRPLSPARIFLTRHLLVLGILATWLVLTPSLHLLFCMLFSSSAPLIDHGRLGLRIVEGMPIFLFYAVAVFTASVTRTVVGGVLLTAAAGTAALGWVVACVFVDSATAGDPGVLLASALLPPLLLFAAFRCQRQGRDADRPWSRTRLRLAGPILVLVACLVGSGAATLLHGLGTEWLHDEYPGVAEQPDGSEIFLRRWGGWENVETYRRIDDQHRWGAPVSEDTRELPGPVDGPWEHQQAQFFEDAFFPGRGVYFRGQRYAQGFSRGKRNTYFSSDGYTYLYKMANDRGEGPDRAWLRKLGKGPQQQPFSAQADILTDRYAAEVIIHDPSDGGLWVYDMRGDEPSFARRDLPGGDRFLRADHFREQDTLAQRIIIRTTLLALGERGRYAYDDGAWTAVPLDPGARPAPVKYKRDLRYERAGRFHLTLTAPGGKEVFHHYFRPHRWWERLAEVSLEAPTILRPAPAALASLLTPREKAYEPGGWLFLDPAVAFGSRAPLLGTLLLTALLTLLTARRLKRLEVAPARRWFWLATVLVGGVPGYLCARLIETERAWRPMRKTAEATAPVPAHRVILTA